MSNYDERDMEMAEKAAYDAAMNEAAKYHEAVEAERREKEVRQMDVIAELQAELAAVKDAVRFLEKSVLLQTFTPISHYLAFLLASGARRSEDPETTKQHAQTLLKVLEEEK